MKMAFKLNPLVIRPGLAPYLSGRAPYLSGRLAAYFAIRTRPESSATVKFHLSLPFSTSPPKLKNVPPEPERSQSKVCLTINPKPKARRTTLYQFPSHVSPRTKVVDEIIARVQEHHLIHVRGTPASGKTTLMRLVANKLVETNTAPVYTLTSWNEEKVTKATGWNEYLRQVTGVCGDDWLTYPAYLLLDEAQQTYWDGELWAEFFKSLEGTTCYPFIILFSSYGSPGIGSESFKMQKYHTTPMTLTPEQQIGLRSDEYTEYNLPISTQSGESTEIPTYRPVGLLLEEDEAIYALERYASTTLAPHPSLSADLKKELFRISDGHAGLLLSLVPLLKRIPELRALMLEDIPLDPQIVYKHLFNHPQALFKLLHGSRFSRGLPESEVLQDTDIARVFKKAIINEGLVKSDCENEREEIALEKIWRNGWLHAIKSNNSNRYVFASRVHRWYCTCLFQETAPDNEIPYSTPLSLAKAAIMRFRPRQLSDPPRSLVDDTLPPLEDQYQKEFYRCLFTILLGHMVASPEFMLKTDSKKGRIDFFIAQKKWGLELLRNHDRIVGHMDRFESGGQYHGMVQSGEMEQYIVLDFTVSRPRKPRPEYQGHLYHVVFSRDFREVEVIDASDLKVVYAFTLMENDHHMA